MENDPESSGQGHGHGGGSFGMNAAAVAIGIGLILAFPPLIIVPVGGFTLFLVWQLFRGPK